MIRMKRPLLKHLVLPFAGALCVCVATSAHDPITTKITWDREMVRIISARCTSCHQPNGKAFSLTTYNDARPWAQAILEETLDRQMPPWGAVKGFGQFNNDQGITQDELDLIANWVDGGAPEGDPKDLPADTKSPAKPAFTHGAGEIMVSGEYKLSQPLTLKGLWPKTVSAKASLQITAELPDGSIEPLVWLQDYQSDFDHPFIFETPLVLPAGTAIHGVPPEASIALMPASPKPDASRAEGSN
jgi:hypothetical protein